MSGVSTTHKLYNKHIEQNKTVRDVIDGYDAIVNNRAKYFPQLSTENNNDYLANIKRPAFDSFVEKQLDNLTGLLIQKEPIRELPKTLQPFLANINGQGKTDIDFIQDLSYEISVSGRVGVLIGYIATDNNIIIDKTKYNKNARPIATIYPNESIINWRYTNNKLSLVVLKEVVEQSNGGYDCIEVDQYTVLYLEDDICKRKIIIENEDGEDEVVDGSEITPTVNGNPIDFIPFFAGNQNTLELAPYKPPLYNSSIVSLSLHRLKIDLYRGLYYTASPTPYGSGISEHESGEFELGSSSIHFFDRSDAKLQYLEFDGKGLSEIQTEIENCRTTLANLGAEFLKADTSKAESTETTQIKQKSSNANMSNIADVTSRLMTKIFETFAMYYNIKDDISYKIDLDFNVKTLDSNLIKAIGEQFGMGHISQQDYYNFLREYELTNYNSFEEFQEALNNQSFKLDYDNIEQDEAIKEDSFVTDLRKRLGI